MMKNSILLLASALLFALTANAQPPNDVCSGAFSVTPDGTCYGPGLPQTTTTGAGDHWTGTVGCQSANHDEVWFTFVATGTQLDVTVTSGTIGGDLEFVLVQATGACSGLTLAGSLCGPSVLTGSITGLQVGSTYYYTISSTGSAGTFTTCVNNITPPPAPGQDCGGAGVLCDNSNFSLGSIASGSGSVSGNGSEEDISTFTCFGGDERQSQWYTFTCSQTGTIEFNINPIVASDDYDWVLMDITSSGCALNSAGATVIACNWSGCSDATGISSSPATEPGAQGCGGAPGPCGGGTYERAFCNETSGAMTPPTITAGQTYLLLIDNFSVTNNGFDFTWGGVTGGMTAVIGPQADFTASMSGCDLTIVNNVPTPNMTFEWNFGDGSPVFVGANPPLHSYATGTYTVSLTVTDANGCVATTSEVVSCTVPCATPPTTNAGSDASICPSASYTLSGSFGGTATSVTWSSSGDGSFDDPTLTNATYTPGTNDIALGSVTLLITTDDPDGAGPCVEATDLMILTLEDLVAPTISCPGNQTGSVDASCNFTIPDYTGLATPADNCTFTVTQSPIAGTVVGVGTTTITLTVTDEGGLTDNCTFDVVVSDLIAPVITCPANQTGTVDASCNFALPDYTGMATATDNCGSVTVSQSPAIGSNVGIGTTTITLTADDGNGNTTDCTFDVVVTDATPPTITCPGNQTETPNAVCEFVLPDYTGMATATDNCGAVTVTQSPVAGTTIVGTTTITFTADDGNGNTNTCTFDVVLDDTTDPIISCSGDVTENVDASCNFTLPDYTGTATATDNCGVPTVTQSPVAGTVISGSGTVQLITLTATDANGNTASCTFNVTLDDVTAPTVSCPGNTTENVDASCNFTIPDYISAATISDNCDPSPSVTQSPIAGTLISGHGTVQTVTITALDADGNSNSCSFDITLQDATIPTITCPGNQTESPNAACEFVLPDYTAAATASDNCGAVTITQSPAIGATIVGTTTITLTADDGNGNTNTCTFDVVLDDTTDPTISCAGDVTENVDASCNFNLPDYTGTATASDNCGVPTVTQSPVAGTVISGSGTVQLITLTATDANGNSAICTFNVTLDDVTAPIVTCPADLTENVDASCNFTLPDYTAMATITDNCDPAPSVTQSPLAGTVISGHGTVQTVTITALDVDGNSASCTFDVTLQDAIAPTITCPGDQTNTPNALCEFVLPDYTGMATTSDNCGAVTVTQSPVAGSTIVGTTTITLTADDGNGNTTTCTFSQILDDSTDPIISCPGNVTEDVDANCDFTLPDYTGLATASDNCGSPTVTQSPAIGSVISGTGTVQTITLTATDANGNSASCTFDVTLADTTSPVVTCPADMSESVDASCGFTLPDYSGMATIADNCDAAPSVVQAPAAGTSLSGVGTVQTVTLTATDASGNTGSCSFDITLVDTTAPAVTCPGDITEVPDANCDFTLPDYTSMVTITDNCDASPTVSQSPSAGTVVSGNTVITMIGTDASGNMDSCSFNVIMDDTIPPAIICPTDTMSCDPVISYTVPAGTDNCSGVTTTQTDGSGLSSGSTFPVGTTTLEYTATDGAGNTAVCSFNVTIFPLTTPSVAGPDQVICDSTTGFFLSGNATAAGETGLWTVTSGTVVVVDPTDPNSELTNLDVGTHTLEWTITGPDCGATTSTVTITVSGCITYELSIPTAFTPDGDGVNDTWDIENIDRYPGTRVSIYNRWGDLIFMSEDYNSSNEWDGRYNGKDMPTGSYSYVIQLPDGAEPIMGALTLIR